VVAHHHQGKQHKKTMEEGNYTMRVIASTHKCIASGSCVLASPQVFGQRDEDGVVHILHEHPSLDLLKRVRQAVELCPALVFRIENEEQTADLTIVEDASEI
jgi:ferredoxin